MAAEPEVVACDCVMHRRLDVFSCLLITEVDTVTRTFPLLEVSRAQRFSLFVFFCTVNFYVINQCADANFVVFLSVRLSVRVVSHCCVVVAQCGSRQMYVCLYEIADTNHSPVKVEGCANYPAAGCLLPLLLLLLLCQPRWRRAAAPWYFSDVGESANFGPQPGRNSGN